jgi:hypothetical protein
MRCEYNQPTDVGTWKIGCVCVCVFNDGEQQEITKRCRLSWLTNSAFVEPKCGGKGEVAASQPITAAHMELK